MEILQIAGLGIIAVVLVLVIKPQRPEMAIQISIMAGIVIFMLVVGKLSAVIQLLNGFAHKVNLSIEYLGTLMKIIGIAYISEFAGEICKDAGETSIASKIELAGKVIIIVIAVPIIASLLELIIKIMP